MTAGDVLLGDEMVTVTGTWLKCQTLDIWLDSPDRRLPNSPPNTVRRALCHGVGDKLIVNCAGDYPNGVEIESNVKITGTDLLLDNPSRRLPSAAGQVPRRALVHDFNDKLTLNWGRDYPNGVQILGQLVVDALYVRGGAGFAGPVEAGPLPEPPIVTPGSPQTPPGGGSWGTGPGPVNLVDSIRGLRDQIAELTYKVAVFSPDSSRVVTALSDNHARVWNASTGQQMAVLTGHQATITSVAFSPNGERIVTASEDNTARVWNAGTGQQIAVLSGHNAAVANAVFSPNGAHIVTSSVDNTVRLWDAATGRMIASLR